MKETKTKTEPLKWYEKASRKHYSAEGMVINPRTQKEKPNHASHKDETTASYDKRMASRDTDFYPDNTRTSSHKPHFSSATEVRSTGTRDDRSRSRSTATLVPQSTLFSLTTVPNDAKDALASFDKIAASSHPLSSKQRALLPQQIRSLSHNLTDERGERRLGYMNQTTTLSAYIYYYEWWNLVRLTRLFANLPAETLAFTDGTICLDIGSGPLTVPIALFLARPELRTKKLTWYCMDLSSTSLAAGEELFLSTAARLQCEPWRIIRVKGEIGTPIKEKASFITCANVFNELFDDITMPPDFLAKKYGEKITSYADSMNAHLLIIEPGVPKAARFISLLRDALMRKGFMPDSPCTHCNECPMDGKRGGKWCNFAFSTDDAPNALKKLSEASELPKERAVLSFIALSKRVSVTDSADTQSLLFRITSDPIRLPGNRTGYYACSSEGLLLIVTIAQLRSGEQYKIKRPALLDRIDEKSGAHIVEL